MFSNTITEAYPQNQPIYGNIWHYLKEEKYKELVTHYPHTTDKKIGYRQKIICN